MIFLCGLIKFLAGYVACYNCHLDGASGFLEGVESNHRREKWPA